MVELSPLDAEDEAAVRALVEEHVKRTGSAKGKRVLEAGGRGTGAPFVKVLPLEYKRVLAAKRGAPETQKAAG